MHCVTGSKGDLYFISSGYPYPVENAMAVDATAVRQLSARGLPAMTADPMMQLGPAGTAANVQ